MAGQLRVLAIEDDPALRLLYRSFLSEEGHEVALAADAREGLRKLDERPDVVILDLMLPEVSGYTFLEKMRQRPDMRGVPVVVVSAALPPGRHRLAGASAVIEKPFEFDGLLRTIEGLAHPHPQQHRQH